MIHVDFDPDRLDGELASWWRRWARRAARARERAIAEKANHKFAGRIWKDLKKWLLENVFHGKCAYCEAIAELAGVGAADHYRPKGGVTEFVDGRVRDVVVNGERHPGYYWLAYEWQNLLPACTQCNTVGKGRHFPVDGRRVGHYDTEWDDVAALDAIEKPLLLNPYRDHPETYLKFGVLGVVGAVDDQERGRGLHSIECYHLDRDLLRSARQESQENAWIGYLDAIKTPGGGVRFLEPYRQGRKQFSRAVLDYILLRWEEESPRI